MPLPSPKPSQRLPPAVLCFSHLRWNFVFQRPQHLMTRFARESEVVFFEEPVFNDRTDAHLAVETDVTGVRVATPVLPCGFNPEQAVEAQRELIDEFLSAEGIDDFVSWYYTPMALPFTRQLRPAIAVYDCMDELSAFDGAPAGLMRLERDLLAQSDVVFTGGHSLYAAKRDQHRNVHPFPSSIDLHHFQAARGNIHDPVDQAGIAHPRIGFFGVLDERLDRDLLRAVAEQQPEWQFVLIGPIAKIRWEDLPVGGNLHYLGQKSYGELPGYLANWDVAMLPFAINKSTEFISPTKTPEYLAAAKPVVSTPIRDVVQPYGELGLARIAGDAGAFGVAISHCLEGVPDGWLARVDAFLAKNSWDLTFEEMVAEMGRCRQQTPVPGDRLSGLIEGRLASV